MTWRHGLALASGALIVALVIVTVVDFYRTNGAADRRPDSSLFSHPAAPAYVPGRGFDPDAKRIIDITSLQVSLSRYRATMGRYPNSIADLFPDYAPLDEKGSPLPEAPLDPTTHRQYSYSVNSDGS